jgi:hypothetical protein
VSGVTVTTLFIPSGNPIISSSADVVFGGTHLMRDFLWLAEERQGVGRVVLVSPFLDQRLFEEVSFFGATTTRTKDLLLITTPTKRHDNAIRSMIDLGWRSSEVRVLSGLHSKLYLVLPHAGAPIALVGSHNLTFAGSVSNHELGVLVQGRSEGARVVIAGLEAYAAQLRLQSQAIHDSVSYFLNAA